jgi:hypothetical protein
VFTQDTAHASKPLLSAAIESIDSIAAEFQTNPRNLSGKFAALTSNRSGLSIAKFFMKLQLLNRKIHYWASIIIALPVLLVLSTGLLLQLKKQITWVQPAEQKGSSKELHLSLPHILQICQTIPHVEIKGWDDINRVDVRPSRGMLKVWAKNNWEIQIDAKTGDVLQTAYRRSDLIESLHDGSWFGDGVKLGIFLPAGITLLLLWLTGMYLFFLPIYVRGRRKRNARTQVAVPVAIDK